MNGDADTQAPRGHRGYTKLYGSKLLDSSLWDEPLEVRVLWLYFLAKADAQGFVEVSTLRGLARGANMPMDSTREALAVLEGPDPDSRSQAEDGRRVVRVEDDRRRGWQVVNHGYYRELQTPKQAAHAERQRRYRERQRGTRDARDITRDTSDDTGDARDITCAPTAEAEAEATAEAEAEAEKKGAAALVFAHLRERIQATKRELGIKPATAPRVLSAAQRKAIGARVREHNLEACKRVIAVCEAAARLDPTGRGPAWQYWDATSPFRNSQNFERLLGKWREDGRHAVAQGRARSSGERYPTQPNAGPRPAPPPPIDHEEAMRRMDALD